MKTLIVNAFGGPCCGKTTACWEIAAELKKRGYVTEYVSEYTKELIYDGKMYMLDDSMKNQRIILKNQAHKQDRLLNQVQIVVTDSPLLLSIIYAHDRTPEYTQEILDFYNSHNNFNFVINRPENQNFEQVGRKQNLEESIQKDKEILQLLDDFDMKYHIYNRTPISLAYLVEEIEKSYKKLK